MKTTLNPFENAKRTAQGTGGGVSPAVIEEIQAEISILGSQNETQSQDISDIKAQLEELAGAYSTTEHKTGRKWTDGKDIYEKTVSLGALPNNNEIQIEHGITFDTVVDYIAIAQNSAGVVLKLPFLSPTSSNNVGATVNATKVTVFTGSDRSGFTGYCTIRYTKPTAQE